MRKIALSSVALLVLISTNSFSATIWELIRSEFNSGKYYCTYKLNNSSVQKTIILETPCLDVLYEN